MAAHGTLSVNDAWNAVALEERLELLARAKAHGIIAAAASLLVALAIAYGFDQIWLLAAGLVGAVSIAPLFTNHSWRFGKAKLILSYLAARSIARRYAFGYRLDNLEIILLCRGIAQPYYRNREEEEFSRTTEEIDFESGNYRGKEVWICLLRGGIVILSERKGGAKLEFLTPVLPDITCRRATAEDSAEPGSLIVTGSGFAAGKAVALTSPYPGALYVFEKRLSRLIQEQPALAPRK